MVQYPLENPDQIRGVLQSYKRGELTRAAVLRAVVSFHDWCLPSQPSDSGGSGVRLLEGAGGKWWFMAFSDEAHMQFYDQCNSTDLGRDHFIARGGKLARGMKENVAIAYDVCTDHAFTVEGDEVALLRELGEAQQVEAALAGQQVKGKTPEEALLAYDGYRTRIATSPGGALLASGPCGPQMLRVFTTADAVEAFNAEQGVDTPLERWNGKDLFEQLTIYAHDGALFNDIGGLPGHALSLDAVDAVWRGGQLPAPGQSAPAPDPQVAAPAPQPAEPATPVMVQAGQPCTRCGAPAAGDTDWCLNCGLAMRAPQQPLPLPGAEELGPIFPIIQRHDWPGRGPTIHRSVCWLPRIPGTPWVSIGWETGGMTAYVGQESLAKVGQTAEQVEQHAVANLGRAPGSWEKVMAPSARPDECVLACKDSRSAERILEQDFMRHAQRMFGCDMLAVTMAARNGLVVGPAAMAETLMMMAEHVFGQSGEAAITPWCFAVADGMVRGRFFLENGQLGLDAAF